MGNAAQGNVYLCSSGWSIHSAEHYGMARPVRRPIKWQITVRLNEAEYRALVEYQREGHHSTKSDAVRDLMTRQAQYARWKRSRTGKIVRQEQELRHIAREILKDHPDVSRAQLGYNVMKRAGEIVNASLVRRIAEEMAGSGSSFQSHEAR